MPPTPLPPEILESIILYFRIHADGDFAASLVLEREHLTTLHSLSLSTRLLHRLAQPILYYTLDFIMLRYDRAFPRLLRTFVHNPSLGRHVRRLRMPSKWPPTTSNHFATVGEGWDADNYGGGGGGGARGGADTRALLARLRSLGISADFGDLVAEALMGAGPPLPGPTSVPVTDDVVLAIMLCLCPDVEMVYCYYMAGLVRSPGIAPLVWRVWRNAADAAAVGSSSSSTDDGDDDEGDDPGVSRGGEGRREEVPCARLRELYLVGHGSVGVANVWEMLRLPALTSLGFGTFGGWQPWNGRRWRPRRDLVLDTKVETLDLERFGASPEFFEQVVGMCPRLKQLRLGIEESWHVREWNYGYLRLVGDALRRAARKLDYLMIGLIYWDGMNILRSGTLGSLREITDLQGLEIPIDALWNEGCGGVLSLVELLPTSLEELCILASLRSVSLEMLDEALWQLMESLQFQRLQRVWVERSTPFTIDFQGSRWQSTFTPNDGLNMWRGDKFAPSLTKRTI